MKSVFIRRMMAGAAGSVVSVCWLSLMLLPWGTVQGADAETPQNETNYFDLSLEELMALPVVKIATGLQQPLHQAPSSATVITADDIKYSGYADLDEVLETVPGIHVSHNNSGYSPIYVVRGVYSYSNPEVLVMINGVPQTRLYAGNRTDIWSGMPLRDVERIEVIRGPASAMYGADAYAGVINIITKSAGDINGTETGVRYGSFDTSEAWLLHGKKYGNVNVMLSLQYYETAGQKEEIDADVQTYYDQVFGTSASKAPGSVSLSRKRFDTRLELAMDEWTFRAGYFGHTGWGMGAGDQQALDPVNRVDEDIYSADLTYHNPHVSDDWDITGQASFLHSYWFTTEPLVLFPPGAFGGAYPDGMMVEFGVAEYHANAGLTALYSGWDRHKVRSGIGYNYGNLYKVEIQQNFDLVTLEPLGRMVDYTDTDQAFLPEKDRGNWFGFLQDEWAFQPYWTLTCGARYDYYSDFGSSLNPRLALVWETTPDFTTKLLYGRAFRAPSFVEVYGENDTPGLSPEVVDTVELVFDARMSKTVRGSVNLFQYHISDKIQPVTDAEDPTTVSDNVGAYDGHGVETEWTWMPCPVLMLRGNYSYQVTWNQNDDHDAGNAPHHQAFLHARYEFLPQWTFNNQVKWVGERARSYGDPRPELSDFTHWDLNIRKENLWKHWDFTVGVYNVLDADGREPSLGPDSDGIIGIPHDLPLAGRYAYAEASYTF